VFSTFNYQACFIPNEQVKYSLKFLPRIYRYCAHL